MFLLIKTGLTTPTALGDQSLYTRYIYLLPNTTANPGVLHKILPSCNVVSYILKATDKKVNMVSRGVGLKVLDLRCWT